VLYQLAETVIAVLPPPEDGIVQVIGDLSKPWNREEFTMKLRLVGLIILIGSSIVTPSDAIEDWSGEYEDWLSWYTGVSTPAELEAAWMRQSPRWTNDGILLVLRETSDERVDSEDHRPCLSGFISIRSVGS
jgi:hypothetical protein